MFKNILIPTDLHDGLPKLTHYLEALKTAGARKLIFFHARPIDEDGDKPRLREKSCNRHANYSKSMPQKFQRILKQK